MNRILWVDDEIDLLQPYIIYLKDKGVVVTDNYITAKSMYYSIEFGLAIVKYLTGNDIREKLEGK